MRVLVVVGLASVLFTGCASRRAAVAGVTAAAIGAAAIGCIASASQANCTPQVQECPRGYSLGIDSRCHRNE